MNSDSSPHFDRLQSLVQTRKDIFGRRDVVESFRLYPTFILLFKKRKRKEVKFNLNFNSDNCDNFILHIALYGVMTFGTLTILLFCFVFLYLFVIVLFCLGFLFIEIPLNSRFTFSCWGVVKHSFIHYSATSGPWAIKY